MSGYWTKKQGKIETLNGSGTVVLDWAATGIDIGGFSVSDLEQGDAEAVPIMNRGTFVGWEEGDDKPYSCSWSFRVKRAALTDDATATAIDIVLGTGAAAAIASANPISDGPVAYKTRVTYNKLTTTGGLTFGPGRYSLSNFGEDGETVTGTVSVSGYGVTPF